MASIPRDERQNWPSKQHEDQWGIYKPVITSQMAYRGKYLNLRKRAHINCLTSWCSRSMRRWMNLRLKYSNEDARCNFQFIAILYETCIEVLRTNIVYQCTGHDECCKNHQRKKISDMLKFKVCKMR